MHELSVCQQMISQVEDIAHNKQAHAVDSITIQVGPLSGVEPHLLRQAYPFAAAGTVAEQAELIIETLPIRVRCEQCGQESEVQANRLLCTHCGDYHTQLLSGDELLLASLTLTTEQKEAQHV